MVRETHANRPSRRPGLELEDAATMARAAHHLVAEAARRIHEVEGKPKAMLGVLRTLCSRVKTRNPAPDGRGDRRRL